MLFKYIGTESVPGSGATVVFGNISVAVGGVFECPAHLIERAKRHPHFEAVAETVPDVAPAPVLHQEPSSADGRPKPVLIAEAEAAGVDIDKRWSPQRIADAIAAKKAEAV